MAAGKGLEEERTRGVSRRFFLWAAAVASSLTCIPRSVWPFFVREMGVRTVEEETFRFDSASGSIRWTNGAVTPYRLTVDGLVEKPLTFSYKDLQALPSVYQTSDFHCVEGWSVKDIRWGGFRFEEVMRRVKPRTGVRYVVFHALGKTDSQPSGLDHYVESLPVEELLDPNKECLLALSMDGKPLTHDHGAPLRVVSPYDLGYKGAKYVTRIEFSRAPQPGWWTLANPIYPVEAPVPADRLRKR